MRYAAMYYSSTIICLAYCSSFYTYNLWLLTDELVRKFFAVLNCYLSYFISSAQILGNELHIFIYLLVHAQNILGSRFKIIFQNLVILFFS